jgi:nicotinate-nucleotide adenylyltransferase
MRVAFFGGTFDPPHCGHLAIAHATASRLQLDQVLFAPVGAQPHKVNGPAPASFGDRVEMVRLAIADYPRFQLSLIDAPRDDGKPNYTLHTLQQLRTTLDPEDELFCLLGADSFLTLPKWYHAAELLFVCDFIVAGRPGFSLDQLAPTLPPEVRLARLPEPQGVNSVLFTLATEDSTRPHSRLYLLPDLQEDVSATQIRAALANGADDETVVPSTVVAYIQAHGLYR